MDLKIDPEFQKLIPQPTDEESKQLEDNLVAEGCRDALVVTEDGTILDGHNRYKYCMKHGIPFRTITKHFDSRDDAIAWIIMNQFGRRNISTGQRSALALRLEPILRAKAKARMLSGKKTDPTPNSAGGIQQGEVRDQIAKLAGVGHTTIQEAKQIIEHGTPEQVERMKRGGKGNTVNAVFREVQGVITPKPTPKPELPKEPEPIPEPQKEPETPKREPTIKELIEEVRNPDIPRGYTIEILLEETDSLVENFCISTKRLLVNNSTLLADPGNKRQIAKVLEKAEAKIKEIKEIVK